MAGSKKEGYSFSFSSKTENYIQEVYQNWRKSTLKCQEMNLLMSGFFGNAIKNRFTCKFFRNYV